MLLKDASILIIDDDPDVLTAARLLLKSQAKEVVVEKNPEMLRSIFVKRDFDAVLMDMNFTTTINSGYEGLYWLKKIKALGSKAAVMMITAYGDIDLAVKSLKEGASDFLLKPWQNEQLLTNIKELLKNKSGNNTSPVQNDTDVLARSEQMQQVLKKIEKIAPTQANILLLGESGTGKSLVAKAIHRQSLRAAKPFIKIDVSSLNDTAFDNGLSGYFKNAPATVIGNAAAGFDGSNIGTLFLKGIENLSLHQQASLLPALQNKQTINGEKLAPVDVRLIAATNLPIAKLADESRFKKEFIYYISTVEMWLPPLRKRQGDISFLANHFTKQFAEKYFKAALLLDKKALEKMEQYTFPGNVRELQYVIERAVIMSEGHSIKPADIVFSAIENNEPPQSLTAKMNLSEVEKNTILLAIEKNNGNITKAAKELGLTRTALYRRLNKYDIS